MGLIHLDAGVIIGFLDADDAHHDAARAVLAEAIHHGEELAIAASALAECLVGAARVGEAKIETVRKALDSIPVPVIDLDAEIATDAARLRARHRSLRLPDALVIATAVAWRADRLITTDSQWPTQRAMKLAVKIDRI